MMLRQSILYLAANGLAAAIGFLSVIVLTRLVAPAEYGVFIVAMSLGTVLSTCFFTWQRHAILRFQSEDRADVRLSLLVGYGLTLALHPIAVLILVYVFRIPMEKALAAVLLAAAGAFFELGQEILRARQRVTAYVRGALLRSFTSFAFCLTAVWLGAGGLGLVAAVIGGYLFSTMLLAGHVWSRPRASPCAATLVRLATYGLPITMSGAFVALTLALDRFVLYSVLGTEAAGVYGATAEFIRQCAIIPAISVSLALAPLAVSNMKKEDGNITSGHMADGAELLFAVMLPAAVGLAIAAPHLAETILGPDYRAAAITLIPILAFAFFAHSVSQQYVQLSFGLAERPSLYIFHTGSIFALNLVLMLPLVKAFGIQGAALSLLISETAGVFIGLWMARKAYPLPRIDGRIARIVGAVMIMALVCGATRYLMHRTDALGLAVMVTIGALTYAASAIALDVAHARTPVLAFAASAAGRSAHPPGA
jgi:O-antigen/teichoic acid export membrane protein